MPELRIVGDAANAAGRASAFRADMPTGLFYTPFGADPSMMKRLNRKTSPYTVSHLSSALDVERFSRMHGTFAQSVGKFLKIIPRARVPAPDSDGVRSTAPSTSSAGGVSDASATSATTRAPMNSRLRIVPTSPKLAGSASSTCLWCFRVWPGPRFSALQDLRFRGDAASSTVARSATRSRQARTCSIRRCSTK